MQKLFAELRYGFVSYRIWWDDERSVGAHAQVYAHDNDTGTEGRIALVADIQRAGPLHALEDAAIAARAWDETMLLCDHQRANELV